MMFRLISLAALVSSAFALQDIAASSVIAKKLIEKSRALKDDNNNKDAYDISWMPNYSLRFYGCYHMPSFNYQTQMILNETLVRYKLCPSNSCTATCSGGDYVVQAGTFVNAYTEAKLNAWQYNCEVLREGCETNCTAMASYYSDDATCLTTCYSKNGWSNCTSAWDDVSEDDQLVQKYLGCAKIKGADGNNYYVNVACGNQGKDINMAVYSDQYCSIPASNDIFYDSVGSVLPYHNKSLVGTDCIACAEPTNANDQNNQDKNDNDQALASCQNLYYTAGKCESNLASVSTTPTTDACIFIQNSLPAVAKASTSSFKGSSSSSGGAAAKVFATLFFLTTVGLAGYVYYLIQGNRSNIRLNDNLA